MPKGLDALLARGQKKVLYRFEPIGGDPGRIRTCGLQIRNLMLYPTELRGL
jgi:hypothetical protein